MKINRVYIKNFGGICNREYDLSDGLNVIFGMNESGKSTFLSFIRFMFYGAKKQRSKELSFRDKYMPWNGEGMSGEIVYTHDGAEFSLSRTVSSSARKSDVVLINKTTGEEVSGALAEDIGTELFGMSEQSFLKTMFISSEGTKINSDGEILSKISNVSQSGDENVSYQSIKKELDNMIADLSSTRRSKAIIPAVEERLQALLQEKDELEKLCVRKDFLSKLLSETTIELDRVFSTKDTLTKNLSIIRKNNDITSYEKSLIRLKEAEESLSNEAESELHSNADKYKFLKSITPDEEEILLNSNDVQISADKMQEVLFKDKAASARIRSFIFAILSVGAVAASFFVSALAIGAVVFAILTVFSFLSYKKMDTAAKDLSEKFSQSENRKQAVLNKYGLESSEHYRQLKREESDLSSKDEILKSKADMARRIYEERKSDFDSLCQELNKKYGSTENLEKEEISGNEAQISEQIAHIDEQILNLTAKNAKIKSQLESIADAVPHLTQLHSEIEDLNLKKSEAMENLRILTLASEILDESYEELKGNFAPKLAKATSEIFNSLTGGKYGEIIVNDQFEIQIKNGSKYEISNYFSSGTIQQLYFSLRLGIIELISGNYPLFIDDAFITYDDERFANTAEFLKNYSENNQIIFCTCHRRESNMPGARLSEF